MELFFAYFQPRFSKLQFHEQNYYTSKHETLCSFSLQILHSRIQPIQREPSEDEYFSQYFPQIHVSSRVRTISVELTEYFILLFGALTAEDKHIGGASGCVARLLGGQTWGRLAALRRATGQHSFEHSSSYAFPAGSKDLANF